MFPPRARHLAALALFVGLTAFHTWPMVTAPFTMQLGHADALLHAWNVAWVGHQLVTDPLHLADTNAFHPEKDTLALGEPLIVPGLIGAPLIWAGLPAVPAHNLVWMLGFVLSALCMYALVFAWTDDVWGGLLAGSIWAFNTHVMSRLPHITAIHVGFLPLALLLLERMLTRGRWRDVVALTVCVAGVIVTSGHLALSTMLALTVLFVAEFGAWRADVRAVFARLGAATVAAALLSLPVLLAYWGHAPARSLELAAAGAASLGAYFTTIGTFHYEVWSHLLYQRTGDMLFPGVIAYGLALLGVFSPGSPLPRRRAAALLAIAGVGVVLSLGPALPVYRLLYELLPPLRAIRIPSRFGLLAVFAVAVLAGAGMAALRQRLRHRWWLAAVCALAVATANLESFRPVELYVPYTGLSPLYDILRDDPAEVVVAEVPFYALPRFGPNAAYMLASTAHWRPLVNGYNSSYPDSFERIGSRLAQFPGAVALRELRRLGVNRVLVNTLHYGDRAASVVEQFEAIPGVELIATDAEDNRLYSLASAGRRR